MEFYIAHLEFSSFNSRQQSTQCHISVSFKGTVSRVVLCLKPALPATQECLKRDSITNIISRPFVTPQTCIIGNIWIVKRDSSSRVGAKASCYSPEQSTVPAISGFFKHISRFREFLLYSGQTRICFVYSIINKFRKKILLLLPFRMSRRI